MLLDFQDQLSADQARIEACFERELSQGNELDLAIRHAVLNGGKRLRAHLVYETTRICGGTLNVADFGAMAIEFIHAYSLVHDDLPSMDDDDMRRGQPTLHVKWNEWTAILAGDALQTKAFEVLSHVPIQAERGLNLVTSLAQASGDRGMVRGQFFDLDAESHAQELSLEDIRKLQRDKTGALISWAAEFGARAYAQNIEPFKDYAAHLGLAFQIWDDVLDVESSSETLGKTAGKDAHSGKATFVTHLGLEDAKAQAQSEVDHAKAAISHIAGTQNLKHLADFVISRSY